VDVFIGSTDPNDKFLKTNLFKHLVQYASEHHEVQLTSNYLTLWQHKRGQSQYFVNDTIEVIFDGYFHGMRNNEHTPLLKVLAERLTAGETLIESHESGVFNLVVHDKITHRLYIASDPSSLIPLYYKVDSGHFYLTSHLYLFTRIVHSEPDKLGVLQKIAYGYTLGNRTYFSGWSRICPGEIVVFHIDQRRLESRVGETYFTHYDDYDQLPLEEIWLGLNNAVDGIGKHYNSFGIMLSEGFDSRLVAALFAKNNKPIFTFTHGTPETQGSRIVEDVAHLLNTEHYFDPLASGFPSLTTELLQQLYLSDNLNVAYWRNGMNYFYGLKTDVVMAGTALDTTLGGHAFVPSGQKNIMRQRPPELIRQMFGVIDDDYIEKQAQQIKKNFLDSLTDITFINRMERYLKFYFNQAIVNELVPHIPELAQAGAEEYARFSATGSKLVSQQVQRYFLENRVRKFSFGQELTIRIKNPLAVPTYEPAFMRVMGAIPPRYRLNHQLYFQFMRKYTPAMAHIRSGSFGLSIVYPISILEVARFLGRINDQRITKTYLQSSGKSDFRELRAVNFTEKTARHPEVFANYHDYLVKNAAVLNTRALQDHLKRVMNYEKRAYNNVEFYLAAELSQIYKA